MHENSPLEKARLAFVPALPTQLKSLKELKFEKKERSSPDAKEILPLFPLTQGRPLFEAKQGSSRKTRKLRVGVVFSGGQAAGGHNVIAGLLDGLLLLDPESQLFGFLGGPSGIIEGKSKPLTKESVAAYRNLGGFDLIGSGRTKIETEEQLEAAFQTVQNLDALVIVGGDDSNTNAAVLSEYLLKKKSKTCVIGVPKTIDGDLKNSDVATSFGFDTACKTYSELIGNIARDAKSAKKYTHFIKLMGRSASHIALECALSTRANLTLIGEEVAAKKMTLSQVAELVADVVCKRADKGLNYGVILIPEGLIEFIPEIGELIAELSQDQRASAEKLTPKMRSVFESLPKDLQQQLLLERDPHGNVQVSMIETEKLLIYSTQKELKKRGFKGKFAAQSHFFGYEGRAALPSNFDAHYCYSLGVLAALLADEGLTGYMTAVGNLHLLVSDWSVKALPITMLMHMEMRSGKRKPVIQKALVDLKGRAFQAFEKERAEWAESDIYRYPGPIQFFGGSALTDAPPLTLQIENGKN